jgi:S1-C subfamily serine protease
MHSWAVLAVVALAAAGTLIGLQVIPVIPAPAPAQGGATASEDVGLKPGPTPEMAPGSSSAAPPNPAFDPAPLSFPESPAQPADPPVAVLPAAPGVTSAVSLEDVVSASVPAIVSIETREGRGSGFFAASRTVLTNRHVVGSNISVTVRLSSGASLPGRVEASSSEFDLAVVRVDGASPTQPTLPLGSVANVRPGQEVIAIGLALGIFQNTVTRGIISGVRRADRTTVLQTDAAINPGNSGGPLLNRSGQVIGINTLKITGAADSLGFAIAIDHARGLLSGGQPSESPANASATVSERLAPAFAGRSSTDDMRAEGVRNYERILQVVAPRAAQLDDYWNRIKLNCTVRIAPGYDREWFGLWDGRSALTSPDPSCISAANDLSRLAGEVRAARTDGQEAARRASVLPGQLRDIRRKYRMDWTGWER